MSESETSKLGPTCSCGYSQSHGLVAREPRYTFAGWLTLLLGITTRPKSVRYRCRRCREVIAETEDPAILDDFA